jgi:sialate O-acetylesterase
MDGLHLDYNSLKRVGQRMAFLAAPYVKKGIAPRSEIKLHSVAWAKKSKPTIVVEFTGVSGKLRASGRPTGFVLKKKGTGEVLDWIYKVDLDPSSPTRVLLHVAGGVNDMADELVLYYGAGVNPYVNLVDDRDMAVPAFGPITIR